MLEYQWNDVLIPYWKERPKIADDHGVKNLSRTASRLLLLQPRDADETAQRRPARPVGANVDPSHLFWQGIDPVAAIRYLGDAVHYFHAKDTAVDKYNTAVNGVLDTKSYADEAHRSWIFRSSATAWASGRTSPRRSVSWATITSCPSSTEDSLMTPKEGLEKAIACLREALIHDSNTGDMWWI